MPWINFAVINFGRANKESGSAGEKRHAHDCEWNT